ncbi:hypothetical protein PM082_017687 [Marasmius tenuissimus]|nr:hypothetical protein PM082_017687 [Marasmius tenuissimus]
MFKSAATKIAHNSTLPSLAGNYDLKPLQDLINAEKVVLSSLQKLSADFTRAADALRTWGMGEGEDLGDTLSASTNLLHHFANALSQYATHENTIREHMKSIRTREEALDELKRRRRALVTKADTAERKLSKMSPEHKNLHSQTDTLNRLRDEIRSMDSEIMTEEAALGDFKRSKMKIMLGLKFGALLEACEKGTVAGEFGKLVAMEIPDEVTQPGMARTMYMGHQKVYGLLQEAQQCMGEIAFSTAPTTEPRQPRPPLSEHDNQPSGNYDYNETYSPPRHEGSGGSPQNYLASPQTMGSGHFMDASEISTTGGRSSAPTSPTTYAPPSGPPPHVSAPPFPNPDMNQGFRGSQELGAVPSHPSDPNLPSGGRFATFPVRGNAQGSQSGYQLRDGPPMLSGGGDGPQDDSFSSSIEAALNNSQNGRPSLDGPPPSYTTHQMHSSTSSPPESPSRGVPPMQMDSPWADQPSGAPRGHERSRAITEDVESEEGGLAYDRLDAQADRQHQRNDSEPKHVRFGEVSDVDEELQRRHETERQPNEGPSGDSVAPKSSSRRVPPPTFNPAEEERELNAAAAREISRELDALNFSAHDSARGGRLEEGEMSPTTLARNESFGSAGVLTSRGDVSPLHPPVAPFTQRGPSPRPESTPSSPIQTSSPTTGQSPLSSGPPISHDRASERPLPSPVIPKAPSPILPPSINVPDHRSNSSISSLRGASPYQSDMPRSPLGTRSTSSLVGDRPDRSPGSSPAPPPPGARTISAAAFRRPARTGSDAPSLGGGIGGPGSGIPETTPLHLKKRLPASPYPSSRGPDMGGSPPEPAAMQQRVPSGIQGHGGAQVEEPYDYISAYGSSDAPSGGGGGSPLQADYGSLGRMRVANDYGGSLPPGASPPAPGGYGDGRFATNLENDSLR